MGDGNKPDLDPPCHVQEEGSSPSGDGAAATPTKPTTGDSIETPRQEEEIFTDKEPKVKQEVETSHTSTQTDEAYFVGALGSPPSSPLKLPPTAQTSLSDALSPSLASDSPPARNPIDSLTAKLYKLPLLDQLPATERGEGVPTQALHSPRVQTAGWAGGGNLSTVQKLDLERRKSFSQPSISHKLQTLSKVRPETLGDPQLRTPRTVESTRKMMQVFNRFSPSRSMRRFHQYYQESVTPDLRQFGVRQGRRHIIHGSHAYYYH